MGHKAPLCTPVCRIVRVIPFVFIVQRTDVVFYVGISVGMRLGRTAIMQHVLAMGSNCSLIRVFTLIHFVSPLPSMTFNY